MQRNPRYLAVFCQKCSEREQHDMPLRGPAVPQAATGSGPSSSATSGRELLSPVHGLPSTCRTDALSCFDSPLYTTEPPGLLGEF